MSSVKIIRVALLERVYASIPAPFDTMASDTIDPEHPLKAADGHDAKHDAKHTPW